MYQAKHIKSRDILLSRDVFPSKDAPILVHASDGESYVAKVQRSRTDKGVVKEWLCGHFLKLWNLPVPDFAIVDIQAKHVPIGFHQDYQPFHFERPAFGSYYHEYATDVSLLPSLPESRHRAVSGDLQKLALFDLWTANIDRHGGHYNMLFSGVKPYRFLAIDHEMAMDCLDFGNAPSLQTENESIINSILFQTYVSIQDRERTVSKVDNYEEFRKEIEVLANHLPEILTSMPTEWKEATPDAEYILNATIFTDQWLDKTWETYLSYLKDAS